MTELTIDAMSRPKAAVPLHRIIMLGGDGVGKSALILRFLCNEYDDRYVPTKADIFRKTVLLDGEEVQIDILDTAGEKDNVVIRDSYYRQADGFLCVFSIASEESFHYTQEIRDIVMDLTEDESVPFLLVGNKSDLREERQVPLGECQAAAQEWGVPYVETSAKLRQNVNKIFQDLMRQIRLRKASEPIATNARTACKKRGCHACAIL